MLDDVNNIDASAVKLVDEVEETTLLLPDGSLLLKIPSFIKERR